MRSPKNSLWGVSNNIPQWRYEEDKNYRGMGIDWWCGNRHAKPARGAHVLPDGKTDSPGNKFFWPHLLMDVLSYSPYWTPCVVAHSHPTQKPLKLEIHSFKAKRMDCPCPSILTLLGDLTKPTDKYEHRTSHKWLHFFLNRMQDRTSSLPHCTLIIYKRLGLDQKASRHKHINELLLQHLSKILLAAGNQSEIIFNCCEIMTVNHQ